VTERTRQAPRRTVARRVLLSYALIMTAFALSAGFSVMALRSSAREANLMREGYLPLALSLRGLVANQDTWNTQLNHITTARNPADKRVWFETAIKVGRPKKFGEVRAKLSRAFLQQGDDAARQAGEELLDRLTAIEKFLAEDAEALDQLFVALDRDKSDEAERLRDLLVTRGFQGKKQLSELERTMERNLDSLLDEARARELTGIQLLVALVALTVLVGLLMVLYAHQVAREKVEARSGVPVAAPSAYEIQSFPEMRHGVVGTLDSLEQKGLIETRMGRVFEDKERDVWRARLQIHLTPRGESYIKEVAGYTP